MNDFYVYVHVRTDLGCPFYVGKGRGDRAWVTKNRNNHWNSVVSKTKNYEIYKVLENLTEEDAFYFERELIRYYRENSIKLCNQSDGGEGLFNPPDEVRLRMSEAQKGKIISEDVRLKISNSLKGRSFSEETRKKLSDSKIGHEVSEETRMKISNSLKGGTTVRKGVALSEEHIKKLSKAREGKFWFNNGLEQTYCIPEEKPDGWELGRLKGYKIKDTTKMSEARKNNTHTKGKKWYTDGINSKMLDPNSEIPSDWREGRTFRRKK